MLPLRDGTTTEDPRLDRLIEFDPRSLAFPARTLVAAAPTTPRSYTWKVATNLDQGQEGACVGFGWSHELMARPVVVPNITNQSARELYWQAQQNDDWPGGEYPGAPPPPYSGTSVLAGAKAVQALGHMAEYRWALNLDDVRMVLGYHGPVVFGLNWYAGMMDPAADGRITPTGDVVGGHCILGYRNAEKTKRVYVWNSWGPKWWEGGGWAYLTFDDLETLLHDDGECCVPVKRS